MAEVLATFSETFTTPDGGRYRAQVVGAPNDEGLWEGWIEFISVVNDPPLRTPRETTQPNRADAEYWATGLTPVYLEGALDRALHPPVRTPPAETHALFDAPAPPADTRATRRVAKGDAILDPFSVYEKGESMLQRELAALSTWHLVNIVRGFDLSGKSSAELNALSRAELVSLIIDRVRETYTTFSSGS